ncbi:hypothetical protein GLYMA_01G034402v4 [Glycine max]|nr:hypothetical protein GYH30_000353 [Glycine max]KRH74653.3 hypothetical protein GLYMA_01G034402v4 [Glycine max]
MREKEKTYEIPCDYFNGKWVRDKRGPLYSGTTCVTIEESQSCIINGRQDSTYLHWGWKPSECHLPRFEPNTFLQLISKKHVAFVGDSMGRNQVESLLCLLATASAPKRVTTKGLVGGTLLLTMQACPSIGSLFLCKGFKEQAQGHSMM